MFATNEGDATNPHYPIMGGDWFNPTNSPRSNKPLFADPIDRYDRVVKDGGSPVPQINLNKTPYPSHEKMAEDYSSKRLLFKEPRDLNKVAENPYQPHKWGYIQSAREPTPGRPRPFQFSPREDTKYSEASVPQIDLRKPARHITGYQTPLESKRTRLFEKPRDTNKYEDLDGTKPRFSYNNEAPAHSRHINVIPNSARLFQQPRLTDKYSDVEGSTPRLHVDRSKPPRDTFFVAESTKKDLFKEPREIFKLNEHQKTVKMIPTRIPEEEQETKRILFAKPRDNLNDRLVEGSHPAPFYPRQSYRKDSPTFSSQLFK